jgi:hypothetical protein
MRNGSYQRKKAGVIMGEVTAQATKHSMEIMGCV